MFIWLLGIFFFDVYICFSSYIFNMHLIENLIYGGDIVPHVYDVMIISFIIQISILLVIYFFILKLS